MWGTRKTVLGTLAKRRDAAEENLSAAVRNAVLEECREIVEELRPQSYVGELKVTKAQGLSEVLSMSRVVNTEARAKLGRMLDQMPGGSIGIAGPRGAGKTTLMRAYCAGGVAEIQGRPVLGVQTSAPVEYEPRDFILYLFQSVCRAVLVKFGEDLGAPPWRDEGPWRRMLANPRQRMFVLTLSVMITYLGLSLIVGSMWALRVGEPPPPPSPTVIVVNGAAPTPTPTPAETTARERDSISYYMRGFGFTPGTLFVWGLILTLPGVLLLFSYLVSNTDNNRNQRRGTMPTFMAGKPRPAYIAQAWEWLKTIKFQQSYTSGWSGALKLPAGLEGGLSRAVSMAENQKSLPEIVGGLREFLEAVSTDFAIIIGIDELDKIETDEQAQQFVNEIKSVFGLRHCFYLVSVSESAMSNFERRGIPFRDAFDSSFDDIVRVDYLTLDAAKRLIARRIIGMAHPFRALCYCASGGLARDLIRTCRNLTDIAHERAARNLSGELAPLCQALVRQDLKAKAHAVATSAQKIELEPEAAEFLAGLYKLERASDAGDDLLACCPALSVGAGRDADVADKEEAKRLAEHRLKLAALGEELTTYVYYSDTLLRFFDAALSPEKLQVAEAAGTLHLLARARQSLSIKPSIARSIIDDFRREHDMPPMNFPAPATGGAPHAAAHGGGSPPALLVVADSQAGLQKSIEGLRDVLGRLTQPGKE